MRITKEQLKQMILEELREIRIDTAAGYHSNQGTTMSAADEEPPELIAWLRSQPIDLELDRDSNGNWVVYYDAFDNVNLDNLPPGWSSEALALGGSDEDSSYVISRDDVEVR